MMNSGQMQRMQVEQSLPGRFICAFVTALLRRNLLRLLGWVPMLLFGVAGFTGTAIETPQQYTRTVWRVSDGLPEDTVQALAESKDGLLWIGTTGGLGL